MCLVRKSPHSNKSLGLWACRLWINPGKSGQKNPTMTNGPFLETVTDLARTEMQACLK